MTAALLLGNLPWTLSISCTSKTALVRCFFDAGSRNVWPICCRCLKKLLPFLALNLIGKVTI